MPFVSLIDFLQDLEPQHVPREEHEARAIEEAKKVHKFSDFNLINQSKLDRVNKFIEEKKLEYYQEYSRKRILETPDVIDRKLRYKNMMLLNFELMMAGNFHEMWVLPIFLDPGKIDYFIRSAKDEKISARI